jgi:predicted DNA-binding transcriptional regulator AlpA
MQALTLASADPVRALDDLVDRAAAAYLLGVAARTLDRWHRDQTGPPRVRVGRKVRYRRQALEEWVRGTEGP